MERIRIEMLRAKDMGTTRDAISNLSMELVAGRGGSLSHVSIVGKRVGADAFACVCAARAFVAICGTEKKQYSATLSTGVAGLLNCEIGWKTFARVSTRGHVGNDARGPETPRERHGNPTLGCLLQPAADGVPREQQSVDSLTARGLFEQLFGPYLSMSVERFGGATCAKCSRHFCTSTLLCPGRSPTTCSG